MKKVLYLLGAALLLSGCGFGMTWDIAPVIVEMEVVDAEGHNRFDEKTAGNWLQSTVTARVLPVSYPFSFTGQILVVDGHNRVFD